MEKTALNKIFFIFLFFPLISQGKLRPPSIRVRIAKSLSKVEISGTDLKREIFPSKTSKDYAGKKIIRFNCQSKSTLKKPILFASLKSKTGLLSLKDEKFKGELYVVTGGKSGKCDVVNKTSLENYLGSLLSKEMNAVWPLEVLKAQAVAARTYAYHKIKTKQVSKIKGHEAFYDLESSEKHQVGGNFFDATHKTVRATRDTKGEILINKKGKITPIFFHASCGGKTLRPDQVWENVVKGYKSVKCDPCKVRKNKKWKKALTYKRFRKFLGWVKKGKISPKSIIRIAPDQNNNNSLRVYIDEEILLVSKSHFRRYFGRHKFPSNHFKVTHFKSKIKFSGNGLGHGVGMCQLGSLGLARKGWSYKKILAHYFPGHKLKNIY